MEVIVDGQRNFGVAGEPKDAMSVVAAVNDYLQGQGRAMQMLVVDGHEIAPEQMVSRLQGTELAKVQTIEVKSEDVATMVDRCLRELQEAVPELPTACRKLSEVFQSEHPDDGYDPFTDLADIWGHIKRREQLVAQALRLEESELKVAGADWAQLHAELNNILQEAAAAIEKGDTVLLGDLLEYELAPRAEQEASIVALLQERAHASQAS